MKIQPNYINYADYQWYYKVALVICLTALISCISRVLISKLYKAFNSKDNSLKTIFINSLKPPLHFLIITYGLCIALEIILKQFKFESQFFISNTKLTILVISIFWFAIRIISKFEKYIIYNIKKNPKFKLDHTTLGALTITARISFFIIAALIILDSIGVSISGLLTFGGVSGIIVGFASKDLLTNFFGALTVYLDRPFKVGDWIRLQEKNIEGTVEKIGLRCTILKTLDKRPLYVPNSYFAQVAIENPSRMSHRQINEIIKINIKDFHSVEKILVDIRKILSSNNNIDKKQNFGAHFTGYGANSVNLLIFGYLKSINYLDYLRIKEDILIQSSKIIFNHAASIARSYDEH